MPALFQKFRPLTVCLALSILVHILPTLVLRMTGTFDFGVPVNSPAAVMVDLADPGAGAASAARTEQPVRNAPASAGKFVVAQNPLLLPEPAGSSSPASPGPQATRGPAEARRAKPAPAQNDETEATPPRSGVTPPRTETAPPDAETAPPDAETAPPDAETAPPVAAGADLPRLRTGDFLAAQQEKLSYLISMHGIPIGSAELEAKNEQGVTTITLRVKSNAATSSIFPVDDLVETRHIDGKFIMTRIRQQEGAFRSDVMITINRGKRRVSLVDFARNRNQKLSVPSDGVLDTLSGIYFLRNRPLQVGRTETLHIYDSETYAEVPVEILRREELRLPNLAKVATLVVRPQQISSGIFRSTGAVLIWLTDDDHKVPVKIVTTVALGQITAELVAAESKLAEKVAETSGL